MRLFAQFSTSLIVAAVFVLLQVHATGTRLPSVHSIFGQRHEISPTRKRFTQETVNSLLLIKGGSISTLSEKISLPTLKLILQIALTGFNICCWALPLRSRNFSQNKFSLGIANAFSGGIFLMLAFSHMMPHSAEIFESIGLSGDNTFKFTLLGYLSVFFFEKILLDSHSMLHSASTSSDGHDHGPDSHGHQGHDECKVCSTASVEGGGSLSPSSAILLLLAMAMHSLLETMALGLATDKASAVFMAASVGLHQPAESLALLVAFLKTSMSRAAIVKWLAAYSAIGPLGVTAGVLISQIASPFFSAVIVAMTAGTFLYVGATEVRCGLYSSLRRTD